jgi:hypothetical protein
MWLGKPRKCTNARYIEIQNKPERKKVSKPGSCCAGAVAEIQKRRRSERVAEAVL